MDNLSESNSKTDSQVNSPIQLQHNSKPSSQDQTSAISKTKQKPSKSSTEPIKFGTFSGVFLPSFLTILGAVMYYIAPQIVGNVGLLNTLLIVLIAHSVTIATAYSISAIATNIKVKGGGLYYLISRSLGSEFGGSLGIQLYLAQTVATSFYAIAFARAISSILGYFSIFVSEMYIALIAVFFFGVIVFIGANFVIKLQYVIFASIVLSLISIFLGPNTVDIATNLVVPATLSFWVAFAMFFPAVTGIDAGVGMSGDLKTPRRSLVKGTFIAILITLAIYVALVVKYALAAPAFELATNPTIVQSIALVGPLVLLGVLMATSSSALGSLMTAPRCLVAMADDKVLPSWLQFLGKKFGKNNEPRIAIIVSTLIGMGVIFMGSLELVSQAVSILFLSVYGWINGAAFFEKISRNPSYRPTFNAPAFVSLYGVIVAYAIMFLFNPFIMVGVVLFQILVFTLLYRSHTSMKIEGVWQGVFFEIMRFMLKIMKDSSKGMKNWRPTLLAFSTKESNTKTMSHILHWIAGRSSITKLYFLSKGNIATKEDVVIKDNIQNSLLEYTKQEKLEIFPRSILSKSFQETMDSFIQSESFGNVQLNTVVIDLDSDIDFHRFLHDMSISEKNLVILKNNQGITQYSRVDVWWSSERNGNFMLLLSYLITHSSQWLKQGAVIRVHTVVLDKDLQKDEIATLREMIEDSRIENIELEVIEQTKPEIFEAIDDHSYDADLVIIGMPKSLKGATDLEIRRRLNLYTKSLKSTLIVHANTAIDFKIN
jgi:amino acid transporter